MNKLFKVGTILALSLVLFSGALSAKETRDRNKTSIKSKIESAAEKVVATFTTEYSGADLLNILADIDLNIKNNNLKAAQNLAGKITDYLDYRKEELSENRAKYKEVKYNGDVVAELKYGNWFNSKTVIIPLNFRDRTSEIALKNKEEITFFRNNEINSAKVRYVGYDIEDNEIGANLNHLLSNLNAGATDKVREDIKNIYGKLLVDYNSKISLVLKIRDHLETARFLLENNQAKAAQDVIGITDSLMLSLIEFKSNSPEEQKRIKNLHKQLNNVSKAADANYLSEWEKIPEEIERWWKK